jgi:RNA polymerase sigma factor (sigma-70 family)
MTERLLSRARAGDELAFRELTDPFRRELELLCYRILGSLQDAEDMLQETLLAAWRGLDEFQGRASLRTWLYRIATNRCLNLLRSKARRPAEEVPPMPDPPPPTRRSEPIWLQPYPDILLEGLPDSAPRPGGALRDEGSDHARVRRRAATNAAAAAHRPCAARCTRLLGRRKRDDPANQRGVGQRGAPTRTRSARPATDRLLACASPGLAAGTRDRRPLRGSGRARRHESRRRPTRR